MLFILLTAGLVGEKDQPALPGKTRITLVGVSLLVILATFAGMLISWTPVGCETILGVQGRYFLPVLPLLLLALPGNRIRLERDITLPCFLCFTVLSWLVLRDVLNAF